MKRMFAVAVVLAFALAAPGRAVAGEDEGYCVESEMKQMPNPLLEIITIPFKMVAVLTYLPRCMAEKFPVNEE